MKSKNRIIYVSIANQVKGNWIRIATNKKIPVTVGDASSKKDIGGYYVISGGDLKTLLKGLKDANN